MKKLYRSAHSIAISYGPNVRTDTSDLLIGDDGYYNRGLGWHPDGAFTGKFTTPMSHWFHYCMSWSQASRTIKIFLNGDQIGSGTTGRETLISAAGDFFLGHNPGDGRDNWMFGGQLFNLNMFSVELSPTEISKVARSGLCSNEEEKMGEKRVLKWEYILNVTRSGSVTEVDTGCPSREQLLEQVVNLATLQEQTREKLDRKLDSVIAQLADMKRSEEDELGVDANWTKKGRHEECESHSSCLPFLFNYEIILLFMI